MTKPDLIESPGAHVSRRARSAFMYVAIVLILGSLVRMWNLHLLAPFIDESAHIYAATHYDFYPLLERMRLGKMLGYVLFYPTARFADDVLGATRLLVAGLGVLTTLGIFVFTRRLSSMVAAVFGSILWSFMPYSVFHDRMALHDPIASACIIWSMVACVEGIVNKSSLRGLFSGILLGLAILTKANAAIAIIWLALIAGAVIDYRNLRSYASVCAAFIGGVAIPASAIFWVLAKNGLASPGTYFLNMQSAGPAESTIWLNVRTLVGWFADYNSVPFTVFAAVTLLGSWAKPTRIKGALFFSFLISLITHAALFKTWFPRYFLPSLLPLVALAAIVSSEWLYLAGGPWRRCYRRPTDWVPLGGTAALALLLAASAFYWARFNFLITHDPASANLPPLDRYQYVDGWPSASGLDKVAAFLNSQSKEKLLLLVGGFGGGNHGWWSLPLVAKLKPNIAIQSGFINSRQALSQAAAQAAKQPTFILFEPPVYDPPVELSLASPPPKLVFSYERPRVPGGFRLYALDPSTHIGISAEQVRLLGDGLPILTDIMNPNGLETYNGEPFMWLSGSDTILQIDSPKRGTVDLVAMFFPGPSVPDHSTRHLVLKDRRGFSVTAAITEGRMILSVPLHSGSNEIVLSCLEQPKVLKQPNGDTRPLILGVQGLKIEAFHADALAR